MSNTIPNISFKKGSHAEFKTHIYDKSQNIKKADEGTFYFTTDEGCLYVGQSDGTAKRVQGSVVTYESAFDFQSEVIPNPPYSSDIIYFIVQSNALIKWDTDKWIQLNVTANDVATIQSDLSAAIAGEHNRAAAQEAALDAKITGLGGQVQALDGSLQLKANSSDVNDLNDRVGPLETNYQNVEGRVAGIEKDLPGMKTNIANAAAAAASANANADSRVAQGTYDQFVTEQNKTNDELRKSIQDLSGISTDLPSITAKLDKAILNDGTVAMTQSLNMGSQTITNLKAGTNDTDAVNKKQLSDAIAGIDKKVDDQNSQFSDIDESIIALQEQFEDAGISTDGKITLTNDLDANEYKIVNIKMAKSPADTDAVNVDYVKKAIKANDAMTFRGTLGSGSGATITDLPTTATNYGGSVINTLKPQQGDTFKVSTIGTYAGKDAKVGDLFINSAADDEAPNWTHISSGYEDTYLQKLVKLTTDSKTIVLSDGVTHSDSGAVSTITFESDNENLEFKVTANQNALTVTASMTWGSFAPQAATE